MKPLRIEPALYYLLNNSVFTGLSDAYFDDLMRCGSPEFRRISKQTRQKFEMKVDEVLPAEFKGSVVGGKYDGSFDIDSSHYLRKLECLPSDASFPHFISMHMRLAWLASSRPEYFYEKS